jgi:hypothetical protein
MAAGAGAEAGAPAASAQQRTSVGEAAGGHAGGAEGTGDGNHSDGVDGRSGDELRMNWGCNGWEWMGEDGGALKKLLTDAKEEAKAHGATSG